MLNKGKSDISQTQLKEILTKIKQLPTSFIIGLREKYNISVGSLEIEVKNRFPKNIDF